MSPALYAILSGTTLGALVTGIYIFERASHKKPRRSLPRLLVIFLLLSIAFSLLGILSKLMEPYVNPIQEKLEQYPSQVIFSGIVIAIILFYLRKKRLDLYGYVEIILGITVLATFAFNPYPGPIAFIVGFATPIYIMIRGADNIDKYRPAHSKAADQAAVS